MKCSQVRIGNIVGFVCGPRRIEVCQVPGCYTPATRQCDFPSGGKTCDRWLCDAHAVRQGKNRDYCPDHPGQLELLNGL